MQNLEALYPEVYSNAKCDHCLQPLYVRLDLLRAVCVHCDCLYTVKGSLLNASHRCFELGVTPPGFTL